MNASLLMERLKKTRFAFVFMHLAHEPFVALFTLLSFILRKDLHASTLQLSIFAMIRPVISFFSFYWSCSITRKKEKLLSNLIGAWLLGRLPFLLFPFFTNVWYLIFASALYQLFYRAATPALMEILKINVDKGPREKLFSFIFILCFIESIALGLFVGRLLDLNPSFWKYLFVGFSLLSISSVIFQKKIPLPSLTEDKNLPQATNKILQPWKDCIYLMKHNPQFARFQWGFMIGGFGLMLLAPVLPIYYTESLLLTHENITIARYIWMGMGVILTTSLWRRGLNVLKISSLTFLILIGFGLFPLMLLCARFSLIYLDIAFFIYGIAQAGSHLLWHLSGTLFAEQNESSSKYTGVNVLMVGVRGLLGPVLGGFLFYLIGAVPLLIFGFLICFSGALFIKKTEKTFKRVSL